jgi:hypothetical protein
MLIPPPPASLCIVHGCREHAGAKGDSLEDYCPAHADEWLTAEASIERREEAA